MSYDICVMRCYEMLKNMTQCNTRCYEMLKKT
nr:MAG TPA: hypothetical protein [Caudoviricetes sp.]